MSQVLPRLADRLRDAGIEFRIIEHRAVFTSVEAAEVRGTPLHSGAKALIMRGPDRFVMAVLPADLSLDSRKLRQLLGSGYLRFASKEELQELTDLTPGSIPPFGSLFGIETICDRRLAENEHIHFNAGSHTRSIRMRYVDWLDFESPRLATIATPS